MKVFISWSGPLSHEVAVALRDWMPCVIQAVEPYVSSEDIDPGARWGGDIATELDDTDFGVLCVTHDNVTAPWLNFEAGALSKSIERSRVVPFLIDLGPSDVPRGPLAQFQTVQPTRADVLRLMRGMNDWCGAMPPDRLEGTIDVWWPHLEVKLQDIQSRSELVQSPSPQRPTADMLAELLELTRGLQRELQVMKGTRSASSVFREPSVYEQDVLRAVSRVAQEQGFELTGLETVHGPTDLKLERQGRKIYVEVSVSQNVIQKARRTLERLERVGISDPLLLTSHKSVREDWTLHYGDRLRIVRWESPQDDEALSMALEEMSRAEDPNS